MRRVATVVVSVVGFAAMGTASLPAASAGDVVAPPQSLSLTVGLPMSQQFGDSRHGPVVYSDNFPARDCMTLDPDAYDGLPAGLQVNTSGVLSGVPVLPAKAQFCFDVVHADLLPRSTAASLLHAVNPAARFTSPPAAGWLTADGR